MENPPYGYDGAFADCTSIEKIILPPSVKTIESCTFRCCSALREIIVEGDSIFINDKAFDECFSLETMIFKSKKVSCVGKTFNPDLKSLKVILPHEHYVCKSTDVFKFPFFSTEIIPYLSVSDISELAGLWIYRSGKTLETWFDNQSFDVAAVFKSIADLLKGQKKVTSKQIKRVQEFADKYSSSLSCELVSEIMNILHSNSGKSV
jgi:hypothetical protein